MVVKIDLNEYVGPYIFEIEGEEGYTLVNGYIDDDVVITGKMPESELPRFYVLAGTKVRFTVPSDCHNALTMDAVTGEISNLAPGNTYEWVISEGEYRPLGCLDISTGEEDLKEVLPSGLKHNHFFFEILGVGASSIDEDMLQAKVPSGTEVDIHRDGYDSKEVIYSTDDNGYIVLKPASLDTYFVIPIVPITEGHSVTVSPETAPEYSLNSNPRTTNDGSPITSSYIDFFDTDDHILVGVSIIPEDYLSYFLPKYEKEAEDGTYLITPSKVGTQNILNIANATRALSNRNKVHTLATISADLTEARSAVNARNQAYEDRIAELSSPSDAPSASKWSAQDIAISALGFDADEELREGFWVYAEAGELEFTIMTDTNGAIVAIPASVVTARKGDSEYDYRTETAVVPNKDPSVVSALTAEWDGWPDQYDRSTYFWETKTLKLTIPTSGYYCITFEFEDGDLGYVYVQHCSAKVLAVSAQGHIGPTAEFIEEQDSILCAFVNAPSFRLDEYTSSPPQMARPDFSRIPVREISDNF